MEEQSFVHKSVLLYETVGSLNIKPGGIYVDGTLGGGGLGDLAIRYGYQRFQMDVMIATVVVLIVMVQAMQSLGDYASKKLNKNKL